MEYLKIWTSFRESISPLNDAEKGRLFDAMLLYAETGELPDFKGNERYIWPTAKQAIDRAAQKAETLRQNGSKGGRPPKPEETKKNQTKANESERNQTKANESYLFDKEKENIKKENKDNDNNAHAGMPFGLTDEDIQASIARNEQIEDTAKGAGLNTSEISMVTARRYADEYGLEKLLDAIRKTALNAAKPSWAYVEGVLKGNGKQNDNRGNNSSVQGSSGEKPSKYAFLFDDAV